ncbi:hypothetical protein DFH06DRAFT_1307821 [Mycena polygramma]|nr:hypothetical protein DFH06DRAFT_1307821 [Mycena polygramma]
MAIGEKVLRTTIAAVAVTPMAQAGSAMVIGEWKVLMTVRVRMCAGLEILQARDDLRKYERAREHCGPALDEYLDARAVGDGMRVHCAHRCCVVKLRVPGGCTGGGRGEFVRRGPRWALAARAQDSLVYGVVDVNTSGASARSSIVGCEDDGAGCAGGGAKPEAMDAMTAMDRSVGYDSRTTCASPRADMVFVCERCASAGVAQTAGEWGRDERVTWRICVRAGACSGSEMSIAWRMYALSAHALGGVSQFRVRVGVSCGGGDGSGWMRVRVERSYIEMPQMCASALEERTLRLQLAATEQARGRGGGEMLAKYLEIVCLRGQWWKQNDARRKRELRRQCASERNVCTVRKHAELRAMLWDAVQGIVRAKGKWGVRSDGGRPVGESDSKSGRRYGLPRPHRNGKYSPSLIFPPSPAGAVDVFAGGARITFGGRALLRSVGVVLEDLEARGCTRACLKGYSKSPASLPEVLLLDHLPGHYIICIRV